MELTMSAKKAKKSSTEGTSIHIPNFTLKKIEAKTSNQQETFNAYVEGLNLLLHGAAGSGKSFISTWLALRDVFAGKYHKLIIIRSIVSSRSPGFLPGNVVEKSSVYEGPYKAICSELFGRGDAYDILKQKGCIEFQTTSFLRGLTFDNCVVLVDEIQNMNYEESRTVITRAGINCKFIFAGDFYQNDLYRNRNDVSGIEEFMDVVDLMESFELIEFGPEDIVRSGICKEFILSEIKLAKFDTSVASSI
jgi:phosphate starvation-inducible protein PhoH